MTKPDRVRDGRTEMGREAKKKRNLPPSPSGEVHPPSCEPDDPQRDDGAEAEREAEKKRNSSGEELEVHPPFCEPGDQAAPQHARPEMRGDQDEMTRAGGAVEGEEEEEEFTPKSPISRPYIPDELNDPSAYPEILAAFNEAHAKYKAKLGTRGNLFTLAHKDNLAPSCLFHHSHLHPIRESAKKAVLHAAKSIIMLSSFVDEKPLANCCGVWVKWDEENKTGIILTTAHLIRTKHPTENHWEARDEYNNKADVTVHLLDDTTAKARFLYHQQHYDLAFFEVRVEESVQLASFNGSLHCGQDVFRLGRDDCMNLRITLRITHSRVEYWNPVSDERHHYMYLSHEKDDDDLCDDDGGSIIDLDGQFVGLVNNHVNKCFVPSSILEKCLDLWSEIRYIPRLHLGMQFTSIKLLDPIHVEKMWRMYKIEDGLIVEEVSKESHAEKLGICMGDIIERFNGDCISTTIELERMLLGRCWDHLGQGNSLNADIDVSIQVFHTEERLRRTVNLTVNVSDGGEIVRRRTCPITEGTSTSAQSGKHVADDPCLQRPTLTWEDLARRYT